MHLFQVSGITAMKGFSEHMCESGFLPWLTSDVRSRGLIRGEEGEEGEAGWPGYPGALEGRLSCAAQRETLSLKGS